MKKVTLEQVLSWGGCYSNERIKEIFGKRKTITSAFILKLDISDKDKIWALLRNDFLTDRQLRLIACECAELVLHLFENIFPDDKRPYLSIEASKAYALNPSDAARSAAESARSAARSAWSAAGSAEVMQDKLHLEIIKKYLKEKQL